MRAMVTGAWLFTLLCHFFIQHDDAIEPLNRANYNVSAAIHRRRDDDPGSTCYNRDPH
jgi:hypothetical protein